MIDLSETIKEAVEEANPPVILAPELVHIRYLGVDVAARAIYVGEIEEDSPDTFAQALTYLAARGDAPVRLMLNTPGGDVTAMFALHDLIRTAPVPVHAFAYGEVVSAGVLLLACCHHRTVTESCVLMSHEATVGEETELGLRAAKDRRQWEDWSHTWWCELMARYTPDDKDAGWWKRKTERKAEYWRLGGQQIVDEGLADEVRR